MQNTKYVVDYIVSSRLEAVPAQALAVAKGAIQDCVGVALAGARHAAGAIPAEWARKCLGCGSATVWGQNFKTSAHDAALVNGTAAHALDYDDVTWGLIGHPSVSLVPAVFAIGEAIKASGRDVLHAYVVGFEVMAKLGRTTQPRHSLDGGWHATGTIGAFGATAACCKLIGLDAGQTAHALGIVYSMTSGNVSNFGTMCKPLHAGLAARNAVEASLWAQAGFTALPHPFDGPRGFHEVYSRGLPADMAPLAELGQVYELVERGVVIKPYPCGVALHPAIDAVHALKQEQAIDPDDVVSGEAGVTRYTFDKLCYLVPKTGLEAKFSMPYTIARAILDESIGFDTFTDALVREEKAQALTRRISMYVHEGIESAWKMGSRPVSVRLHLRDGRVRERQVDISKGNPEAAMTPAELNVKFEDCARLSLDPAAMQASSQCLQDIENVKAIADLTLHLGGQRRAAAA
ncbi:MAG TPA: MmgE/PrpD family protein [Xanthobacteraceae bacterium]